MIPRFFWRSQFAGGSGGEEIIGGRSRAPRIDCEIFDRRHSITEAIARCSDVCVADRVVEALNKQEPNR